MNGQVQIIELAIFNLHAAEDSLKADVAGMLGASRTNREWLLWADESPDGVAGVDDTINLEGSGNKECQRRTKSNNSLDASGNSEPLIENLPHDVVDSRRVNSGVRFLLNALAQDIEPASLTYNQAEDCLNANATGMLGASRREPGVNDIVGGIARRRWVRRMIESTLKAQDAQNGNGARNLTTHGTGLAGSMDVIRKIGCFSHGLLAG